MSSKQLSGDIKYVLKVNAIKPDPVSSTADQLRGYDHLYYVSCEYDNEDIATASFVPIKNRNDNDSSMYHIIIKGWTACQEKKKNCDFHFNL